MPSLVLETRSRTSSRIRLHTRVCLSEDVLETELLSCRNIISVLPDIRCYSGKVHQLSQIWAWKDRSVRHSLRVVVVREIFDIFQSGGILVPKQLRYVVAMIRRQKEVACLDDAFRLERTADCNLPVGFGCRFGYRCPIAGVSGDWETEGREHC